MDRIIAATYRIISFVLLAAVLIPMVFSTASGIDTSVIFVIDASGSMDEENAEGTSHKIDDAKNAAMAGIRDMNNTTEVALIVFYDCDEITLVHGFSTDFTSVVDAVRTIRAHRNTPLSGAIVLAVEYMRDNANGKEGAIILLTDGGESCSGSPVAAADRVKEIRIDCRLHVIDYGSEAGAELRRVAVAGGGQYLDPDDPDELTEHVKKASDPDYWPRLEAEFGRPDTDSFEDDASRIADIVMNVLVMALIAGLLAIFLVFILNAVYLAAGAVFKKDERPDRESRWWLLILVGWWSGKWRKWRKERREYREKLRADRELTAFDRRTASEMKRADRERLAIELRRIREERRKAAGPVWDICPAGPMLDSAKHGKEDRELAERRMADERKRAEDERLAEERKREEERKADERRRAEDERRVAETKKRKELLACVSALAANELGLLPPKDLEMKILLEPFDAQGSVDEYRKNIEEGLERRKTELERGREEERKRREEERTRRKEERKTKKKSKGRDTCPACGEGIRYVGSYRRWYCDRCRKYLPKSFKGLEKGG